jgi:peptidoglycan hydrolase-like protein with peptidoglycan-binding domain
MQILKSSVGRSGANQPNDVRIVQTLLNDWRGKNKRGPIAIDGYVGPETIDAITDFQRTATGIVDGRVDPGGPAIRKLVEGVPPSEVLQAAVLGLLALIADYDPYHPTFPGRMDTFRNVFKILRSRTY